MGERRRRVREARAAVAAALVNPGVRRLQLAWAGCATADLAQDVALAVHAFDLGGVGGVGVMGLLRSLPAAVVGPLAAGVADRHPRQRVLAAVLLVRSALLAVLAWAVAAEAPLAVVYVVAAVDSCVYTLYWPAQSALLPELARTAEELTAANAAATLLENVGALVGPGLAGVLLAVSGPGVVFGASAALTAVAALLATRITATRRFAPVEPESAGDTLLGGFRLLLADPAPRLVALLYLVHTLCIGALSVLVVVTAIELLGLDDSGVGFLGAALGAGGIAGSVAALGLVGHQRLTRPFRLALVAWAAALAVVALVPRVPAAAAALVLVGGCTAVVDVCALNVLQRIVPERLLARVLGVVEGSWWAMFGLGSLAVAPLVETVGVRPGLALTAGLLAVVSLLGGATLGSVDARARAPEAQLAALAGVPLFAAQPPLALERLALELVPVTVAPGQAVVTRGEPGDRFYMVEEGTLEVITDDGRAAAELGPGDWFGEVALLDDVRRTATVRAVSGARLFALDRHRFLTAVATHPRTAERGLGADGRARIGPLGGGGHG
ncbi:MAG TPA: cyclic nucleotide-binding domain-containing protein [Acidimicrobiales bacterium]|nr:cyclic nucleotide-binding domain-containing protein [Acidimicrobiales bacterium]